MREAGEYWSRVTARKRKPILKVNILKNDPVSAPTIGKNINVYNLFWIPIPKEMKKRAKQSKKSKENMSYREKILYYILYIIIKQN